MKLEDQVCSLELAKALKELGVIQESLYYYYEDKMEAHAHYELQNRLYIAHEAENPPDQKYASAYTAAELGEILKGYELPYFNWGTGWQIRQIKDYIRPKNEVNARAILLFNLIQDGLFIDTNLLKAAEQNKFSDKICQNCSKGIICFGCKKVCYPKIKSKIKNWKEIEKLLCKEWCLWPDDPEKHGPEHTEPEGHSIDHWFDLIKRLLNASKE